ncbi:hypothetical protein CHS0354_042658 [Potamilus streckersoni]|uniref:Uncharacterized protein n=1 Tax=Potamilus streckersoni TaxID=2493646 RepID=A0AAE0TEY6_9BIVA|nr:hypothetical protein CHS0354_042658 [Potamilus streckersoni]
MGLFHNICANLYDILHATQVTGELRGAAMSRWNQARALKYRMRGVKIESVRPLCSLSIFITEK